jgi:alpha-soluble NSF attachment protein
VRAAEAYNQGGEIAEALKVYRAAVRLHMNNDAFTTAAKMWKEIAKLEEKRDQLGAAADAWDKAASCHEAGNVKTSATECYLHVARLAALQLDYKKAITLYEKVSMASQETGRGVWSASDHLYKASLCHFVLDAKANAVCHTTLWDLFVI